MDKIINDFIENLNEELNKNTNEHMENNYLHVLSILSDKIINQAINKKFQKVQSILLNKTNLRYGTLNLYDYTFEITEDQKEFKISIGKMLFLHVKSETTPQERDLIKLSLSQNKIQEENKETAINLIKKPFSNQLKTVNNILYIEQAFKIIDNIYFTLNQ